MVNSPTTQLYGISKPVKNKESQMWLCNGSVEEVARQGESERHFNPLKAELNPICQLLALLGAHHILHISGIRVNCGEIGSHCWKVSRFPAISFWLE